MKYIASTICFLALCTVIGYSVAVSNQPAWLLLFFFIKPMYPNCECDEENKNSN